MRTLLASLLLLALVAPSVRAICNMPPPRDERPPRGGPGDDPDEPPPAPPTPPERGGPTTPAPTPPSTTTRDPNGGRAPGSRTGRRASGPNYEASWRLWWELNREHWYGLRKTILSKDTVTSGTGVADPVVAYRAKVRDALLDVAKQSAARSNVRAAALRALGRAGREEDARLFLAVLRDSRRSAIEHEGAAIGLGTLARIDDPALRKEVRDFYGDLLAKRDVLGSNGRRLAILALSMRGRDDPMVSWMLGERLGKLRGSEQDAATLLFAAGLTRDPRLLPVVMNGVRGKKIGGRNLSDLARGRAALGLAISGDAAAAPLLAKVLISRRARIDTRRSAAVGLGMLLRDDTVPAERYAECAKALERAFLWDKDPLVQGYAAMSMGTAREPIGIRSLRKAVDDGDRIVRPFAALALGLAAERAKDGEKIRRSLFRDLQKSRQIERTAALSIAVGVSGAPDARDHLFDCLQRKRLKDDVRAPAIQALGLLRRPTPDIEETLHHALDDRSHTVVEDASLALGFLGHRTTARRLVEKLVKTPSPGVQIHMVAALSHLGGTAAIDPLLAVLGDSGRKHTMRVSAASALGILVDDREVDPLFEIDAHTYPYGLTVASRALVVVY